MPVTYIVDGDTIHVRWHGADQRVRVIGIDTPELHPSPRCGAVAARRFAVRALQGRQVRLTPQVERTDRYGRWLDNVTPVDGPLAGRDYASAIERVGLARRLTIAPNTVKAAAIMRNENIAKTARSGLWGLCGYASAFPDRPVDGSPQRG